MSKLNRAELLYIGLKLEERALSYYHNALNCGLDEDLKLLLTKLAGFEREHLDTIEGLLGKTGKARIRNNFDGDAFLYLQALSGEASSTLLGLDNACPAAGTSREDILKTAISIEKASVAFYRSLARHSSVFGRIELARMIDEEEEHLAELELLKSSS